MTAQDQATPAWEQILSLLPQLSDEEVKELLHRVMTEGDRRDFGYYWWE